MVLQESGGDPLAYSQSGAVGLLQVMPRDGLAAAHPCNCFWNRPSITELQDAEFNLDYGISHLRGKLIQGGLLAEGLRLYGPEGSAATYEQYAYIVISIRDKILAAQ